LKYVLERVEMKKLQVSLATLLALVLLTSLSACAPAKLSMDNVTEIIDTRTAEEYNKSHIVGAINIEMATGGFIAEAVEVENKGTIYVYGETVEEAAEAVINMRELGFKSVLNIGTFADAQNVLPRKVNK
jgi:rhodanese-related sulfurtransferase